MSRRSGLTAMQAQGRAASRMTVGTRMWTEQPLDAMNAKRERYILAAQLSTAVTPLVPPSYIQYVKYQGGAPQSYYISLNAGQQAVFVIATSQGGVGKGSQPQPITIGAGWRILRDDIAGAQRTVVVTRDATVNENTLVVSTPPKTFLWNELGMAGYIITPAAVDPMKYRITVPYPPWQTIDNTVTLHQWQGPSTVYRLRSLTARGLYNFWDGANGDVSGHYQSQMGLLSPQTAFYNPVWTSNPEPYLTTPWVTGSWRHRSIGASGTPHWTEHHIQLAAPR
jgi:hypothetical protein